MELDYLTTFDAIAEFVGQLWEMFKDTKRVSPLALYNRLISHIRTASNQEGLKRSVEGFKEFFVENDRYLVSESLTSMPATAKIAFGSSKSTYLEIGKFVHDPRTDQETRIVISQHLLTISELISHSDEKEKLLNDPQKLLFTESLKEEEEDNGVADILPPGSTEATLVNSVFKKVKASKPDLRGDPTQAMMNVFKSGAISELFEGVKKGKENGSLTQKGMITTVKSLLDKMSNESESGENA